MSYFVPGTYRATSRRFARTRARPGYGAMSRWRRPTVSMAGRRVVRGAVARAARSMLNTRTAGFLGIETKYFDNTLVDTAISAATTAAGAEMDPSASSMISTPAVGDGATNRDGKRIVIKNVQIKGMVRRAATEDAVDPPGVNLVYLALVQDTQTNGAQLNSEDVFANASGSVYGNHAPLRNLLYANRFKVLKSTVLDLSARTMSVEGDNLHSTAAVAVPFEWFCPNLDLPVNFNAGTTADVANVTDHSLHVIAYATATGATLTYNSRIRFQG